ncbi:MAG: InlB B-repeat-containing protein [Lachnospiraceae bacterium]
MEKHRTIKKITALVLVIALLLENPLIYMLGNFHRSLPKSLLELTTLFDHMATQENDGFQFSLYYQLKGGRNAPSNPTRYDITQLPLKLGIPSRDGYDFAGWYTDSAYQNKITELNQKNCDTYMLYAKWTKCLDAEETVRTYEYQNRLNRGTKILKNCKYAFLDHVKIPGMPATREEDLMKQRISGENQCPQGLCLTDDYILVTAYCVQGGKVGSLHVFDRETGEYLVTLGMKETSHLGGVAFDGSHVWICHSDNQTLECMDYQYLKMLAQLKLKKCVDCTESITECKVENRPSCVTCYDGHIWVATQTAFFKSLMFSYVYTNGELVADGCYEIPDKVQGIDFDRNGHVYLSTSLGRKRSSYLKQYQSLKELDRHPNWPQKKIEMPPCAEEIDVDGGKVYVLFESAGLKYFAGTDGKGNSYAPIDKILSIQLSSFL